MDTALKFLQIPDVNRLGDFCKYCCGDGKCEKCLYKGRCKAYLVLFSDMKDKGKRLFCLDGIESIPKQKHARVVEPMELKPVRGRR